MTCRATIAPKALTDAKSQLLAVPFMMIFAGTSWGACNYQDIDINCSGNIQKPDAIYDNPAGTAINDTIALCPAPGGTTTNVTWTLSPGFGCSQTAEGISCGTMTLKAPTSPGLSPLKFGGNTPAGPALFAVTAKDANSDVITCTRNYSIGHAPPGGGWGDPHVTTIDGIHYDFQSAGEFTVLRGKDIELQARQVPVSTTNVPGPNAYTGLQTCVAIYSAVAMKVGSQRVTYEPNISGEPDTSGLQLRVDGTLTQLTDAGIDLAAGRIVRPWGGGGIEVDYRNGTTVIVTPAYWPDQGKWYLNINVFGAEAGQGIYGRLADGSWLPALPDGSSLGSKPNSASDRYNQLYDKFANAWRVTDATSLFDYRPGGKTQDFTLAEWPREAPRSCEIQGQTSAKPADPGVAEKACSGILDETLAANCIFDVSITGFPGFSPTYRLTEQSQPNATRITVKGDRPTTAVGETAAFVATVEQAAQKDAKALAGTVQFIVDGKNAEGPVPVDGSGKATWSTASLKAGEHLVAAKFIPEGGWGSQRGSQSMQESHTVTAARPNYYWWLVALLVLAALVLWRRLRTH